MKRYINILVCAILGFLAVSCTSPLEQQTLSMADGEGVIQLNVDFDTKAVRDLNAEDNFVMKIYQLTTTNGETTKGLVRKFTSLAEIPQYIWLLEGNYSVEVTVGEKAAASFDKRYFYGTNNFTIIPKQIVGVNVACSMENIPVAVAYDDTVVAHFATSYSTCVTVGDEVGSAGDASTLCYTDSVTGYFLMPNECTTLSWRFEGKDSEGQTVSQSGQIKDVVAHTLYTLKFKYSKDAGGNLVVSATVDTTAEYREDSIAFNPDPVVKGEGFNINEPYNYLTGERTYIITALDNITLLNIVAEGQTFDLMNAAPLGITVTPVTNKEYRVTLADDFFNDLTGGAQTLTFRINDASGGIGVVNVVYNIQGLNPINAAEINLWARTAVARATYFTSSSAAITYREFGGDWTTVPVSGSNEATVLNDICAGHSYELALMLDSQKVGRTVTLTTTAGRQIPNADLEEWCYEGNVCKPYGEGSTKYWGSGNDAAAGLLGASSNLTTPSEDVRPGSAGNKCAYSRSIKASIMGIGKFAAGNLFVGRFVEIKGTNGIVDFGQPFEYNAKPKAVRMWIRYNEGTINEGKYTSGQDLFKIFCCVSNNGAPYRVDTSNESTLFDPATAKNILGYGYFDSRESATEWHILEIPINYADEVSMANYLVLTITCSGYGDYFTGSTDSWMYIDDVELVY